MLTVPPVTALALTNDHSFLMVCVWLFGLTHFVLTLSVYLQSENLRHFRESGRNVSAMSALAAGPGAMLLPPGVLQALAAVLASPELDAAASNLEAGGLA